MAAGAQPSPDPVLPAVPGTPLGASLVPHPSPCPMAVSSALCIGARLGNGLSLPQQALASLLCPCPGAHPGVCVQESQGAAGSGHW